MRALLPPDPLDISAGAGLRLMLSAGVLVLLWAAVAWAIAGA